MTTKTESAKKGDPLHDAMRAHVAQGELPGLVTLVSKGDDVRVDAMGTLRMGGTVPMERDSIFRISSMTKPMAAAVTMMLVEDGTFALDTPVDRWLPELAHMRVLKRLDGPLDETVPAARAITVGDLLTFRVGFGIVWGPPDALPIQRAADALHLGAFGPPRPQTPPPPDEWMRRFAMLPLMKQPGECWMYNTSGEILSVLLARASGRTLDTLFEERLFAPLGMRDTAFFVPAAKMKRFATSYMPNQATGALDTFDEAEGGEWSRPPLFPSASAGLVSTADDCFAFARMMKQKGELGKARLLSAASVEAMTTDQIPAAQKSASRFSLDPTFWDTFAWGLGLGIVSHTNAEGPSGFGWDGGLGTCLWWDPARDRVAILMTQRSAYPAMSPLYRDFWSAMNAAS